MKRAFLMLCALLAGCSAPPGKPAPVAPAENVPVSPLAQEICRRAGKLDAWHEGEMTSGSEGLGWYVTSRFTDGKLEVWKCQERWGTGYGFSLKGESLWRGLDATDEEHLRGIARRLFLALDERKRAKEQAEAEKKRAAEAERLLRILCPGAK